MLGAVTDDRRSDELLHDNRHCLAPAHAVLHERRLRLRHLRHDEEDSPDNGHRLRTGRRGACPGSVRRHRVRQCQLRLRRGTGRHKESVREDTHGQGDGRHRRQRRGQIDAVQAASSSLRAEERRDPLRRGRHRQILPDRLARQVRRRPSAQSAYRRHRAREHRLRS